MGHLESLVDPATQALASTNVSFCASTGSFWEIFFGRQEEFLDTQDLSVPRGIWTTGSIRTYDGRYDMTLNATSRLQEIAQHFGVPIRVFSELPRLS